ncbi:MAG TPA: hypothetical protein GX729_06550 [Firmicutes bacterium]|nr:hypothetical protein [Bacillota bacterium]
MGGENGFFPRAKKLNPVLLVLSVLQIYERPVQQSGVHTDSGGFLALALGIAISIMELVHVYDLFMGIGGMAESIAGFMRRCEDSLG